MPTVRDSRGAPIVQFDAALEISPFRLLRRLTEANPPLLVDVRPGEVDRTLAGAVRWPGETWIPPEDADTVLFDDDGSRALELADELQSRGHERVRALFGGLELYAFCLDPEIVGSDTHLRSGQQSDQGNRRGLRRG